MSISGPFGHRGKGGGAQLPCWVEHPKHNLADLIEPDGERCSHRFLNLRKAQQACTTTAGCGGVGKDNGLRCEGKVLEYELRRAGKIEPLPFATAWLSHPNATGSGCLDLQRKLKSSLAAHGVVASRERTQRRAALTEEEMRVDKTLPGPVVRARENLADYSRLGAILNAQLLIARQRVERGPPAFERFPDKAFRYRNWGSQTRHGRGDACVAREIRTRATAAAEPEQPMPCQATSPAQVCVVLGDWVESY